MTGPACKRCKKAGLPSLITNNPGRFNDYCVDCEREIEREDNVYWAEYERIEADFHNDYQKNGG